MMKKTSLWLAFVLSGLFALTSCKKLDLEVDVPSCLKKEIRKIKREEVRNPPAKVWRLIADGKTYFYITSDCCDQYNYLYDDHCDIVCAPDGGFTGAGDGNCPDFGDSTQTTLVWEDDRD